MTSSFKILKTEVASLEELFPRTHSRVRVVSSGYDEFVIHFVDGRKKFVLTCSGLDSYLENEPVWFSDDEDATITSAIESVVSSCKKTVSGTLFVLLSKICSNRKLAQLPELAKLEALTESSSMSCAVSTGASSHLRRGHPCPSMSSSSHGSADEDGVEMEEEDLDIDFLDEDDGEYPGIDNFVLAPMDRSDAAAGVDSGCDMDAGDRAVLEKVKKTAMTEFAKGKVAGGSVQATDRLMKELKELFRSDSVKTGVIGVALVGDCLYDWIIKLYQFDSDSKLHRDLKRYSAKSGEAQGIELSFTFTEQFPVVAPFVRVLKPVVEGGFVLSGGAICMELLTSQGWSPAYSVEMVVLQIMATMVKGNARINDSKPPGSSYSLNRAKTSFRMLTETHQKNGWFTPPKKDG